MVFDVLAATYDTNFTRSPLAQWLRGRVWERLDRLFEPSMRVLELGCGTGEDALHLARRGVQVVATDASRQMVNITRQKASEHNLPISCTVLDLNDPTTWTLDGEFDGVYSNFGALNCTQEWSTLAGWLESKMSPRSKVGFGVMGRFCLWETLWHSLHLDWRTAGRRWRGQGEARFENGTHMPVFYPSAGQLVRAFAGNFEKSDLRGIGVFLPTSDSFAVIEKRPKLQNLLISLESRFAQRAPFRTWGDHYWLEMTRK